MEKRSRENEEPPPDARSTLVESGRYISGEAKGAPWKRILQASIIAVAGLWIYWPAIHGNWLWDDVGLVAGNESLRSLRGLWDIWFSSPSYDYWPMSSTVFWAEWHLWGDRPAAFHAVGLGLHLLSALLVWRVLGKLGLRWAWLAALVFTIHPLAVESVAWISETKNTLSLLFFLLSLSAYLDYDRTGRRSGHVFSILCFLAAMLSKASVVMLPVTLLLYCWWRRDRISWNDLARLAPHLAIALVLGLAAMHFQSAHAPVDPAVDSRGPITRLVGAETAAVFYLGKVFCPVALIPIYPRWALDKSWPFALLSGTFLAAALWLMCARRSGWGRHALLGFGFFLLNLLPALGFARMTFMNISWVADHFVYLPMIGMIGLFVLGVEACHRRLPAFQQPFLSFAVIALCGLLACGSRLCAAHWEGAEALWSYTIDRNPGAWMAQFNLAAEIHKVPGRLAEAIAHYEEAVRLKPDFAEAHNNLGRALEATPGRLNDAIGHYEEALRLAPDSAEAHNNLGGALEALPGRLDEAIAQYGEALRLKPDFAEAHNNLGSALQSIPGRLNKAVAHYGEALRLRPGFAEAHNNLGGALEAMPGRLDDAIAQYVEALRLKADFVQARLNLARVLGKMPGRLDEAIAQYGEVLRLRPNLAEAHFNLGCDLQKAPGRLDEAIAQYREAVRLKPDYADAYFNLGVALEAMPGRTDEAVTQYEASLRLRPGFARAHFNLACALEKVPGRLDEAIAQYKEAIRLEPDLAEAHGNLGNVLVERPGRLDEAIAQYEEALLLKPDDARAHYGLGFALERMPGQLDRAIAQYEEALRLKTDYAEASNSLGIALCRTGRIQAGIGFIEAALRLHPDFAQAHLARASALLQIGRRDDAIAECGQVLRMRPDDPAARRMLELIRSSH
jgi:tetratricopeptide (TPR) repeat protein